jgi:hypothetical protein
MKKKMIAIVLTLLAFAINGCGTIDKEQLIKDKIKDLESAINSKNEDAFILCFYRGTNSYTSYPFTTNFPVSDTTLHYTFSEPSISGNIASCTSSITRLGSTTTGHTNSFQMIEDGGDYYIEVWDQDSSTVFDSKQPPITTENNE